MRNRSSRTSPLVAERELQNRGDFDTIAFVLQLNQNVKPSRLARLKLIGTKGL